MKVIVLTFTLLTIVTIQNTYSASIENITYTALNSDIFQSDLSEYEVDVDKYLRDLLEVIQFLEDSNTKYITDQDDWLENKKNVAVDDLQNSKKYLYEIINQLHGSDAPISPETFFFAAIESMAVATESLYKSIVIQDD